MTFVVSFSSLVKHLSFVTTGLHYERVHFDLQLNKANTTNTEDPILDLHLSLTNGFASSKIYDKRDDFDFDKVQVFGLWRSSPCFLWCIHFATN